MQHDCHRLSYAAEIDPRVHVRRETGGLGCREDVAEGAVCDDAGAPVYAHDVRGGEEVHGEWSAQDIEGVRRITDFYCAAPRCELRLERPAFLDQLMTENLIRAGVMLCFEDVEVFEKAGDLDEYVDDEVFGCFGGRFPWDCLPLGVAQGRPLPHLQKARRLPPMGLVSQDSPSCGRLM